ncbi:matrix remodeling-associated protein 8-like [Oreochromis aureus]|uniref:matrix remodeling-associated protein 8-like n=1 Tax=Oreochromis aureus TaxID=47969 RepID=UPI001954ED93|nr:matrix remodeling-associated protein 8-like [Oreochromis aureus]
MLLTLLLLVLVSSHASGVEVFVGEESVLLPCQVPANVSRSSTAVVWDRDEFKIPTVHMRLQTGDDLKNQNQRYFRRTIMSDKALQTGDLSLTLRNPTVSDSGNYTCIVRKYGQDEKRTEVELTVKEPPPGDLKLSRHLKALLGVVIGLILLSAAVFGFYKYHRYKRKKRGEALQVDMVEVTEWENSVWLPFKTTVCLPDDVTVEWKHKDRTIFMYPSSQNQPLLQDQDYRGRTEMNEEPLRTGDFSLKLNNLQLTDHGVYICTVYNKSKKLLRQKVVTLSVRDRQVEMVEVADWEKNVKLSFTITDDLPQDATVEWRRSDSKQMMVYMYPSDQNQRDDQDQFYRGRTEMNMEPLRTKDLSLTLKDLQLADRESTPVPSTTRTEKSCFRNQFHSVSGSLSCRWWC